VESRKESRYIRVFFQVAKAKWGWGRVPDYEKIRELERIERTLSISGFGALPTPFS